MHKRTRINMLVIVLPKLLGAAMKLFKAAKGSSVMLAGASFAGYAAFTTWQFSAVLMLALFVHEWGHVLAMRAFGIPVRGIYFIPFVGAMVASEGDALRKHDWQSAVVSMAGPVIGGALALPAAAWYWYSHDPRAAIVAAWIAALNLFNLLPIVPLDGGHVLDAIVRSSSRKAQSFSIAGIVLYCLFLTMMGAGLFLVFALLYIIEGLTRDADANGLVRKNGVLAKVSGWLVASTMTVILTLLAVLALLAVVGLGMLYVLLAGVILLLSIGSVWLPQHLWVHFEWMKNENGEDDVRVTFILPSSMRQAWENFRAAFKEREEEVRGAPASTPALGTEAIPEIVRIPMTSAQHNLMVVGYILATLGFMFVAEALEHVPGAATAQEMLLSSRGPEGDNK